MKPSFIFSMPRVATRDLPGLAVPRSLLWTPLLALLLQACQTPVDHSQAVRERIEAEMQAGADQRHAPAQTTVPANVLSALVPTGAAAGRAEQPPEPRFDLTLNNASVAQVFSALASGSRYSFILGPNLSGTMSVNLHEVTALEALDVLRDMYGFEYRITGRRVFVQAATIQTRMFQVAYPSAHRVGYSDTRVISGSISTVQTAGGGGGGTGGTTTSGTATTSSVTEGSQVATSVDIDFWKELEASLKVIVGSEPGRQIVVSPHTGVIVVRAMPSELRDVESFLKSSRLSIARQVMLEAKIVQVKLNDSYQSGINWASLSAAGNNRFSVGADPSLINVPGSIGRQYGIQDGSIVTTVNTSGTTTTVTPTTLGQLLASPLSTSTNGVLGIAFNTKNFYGLLAFLETQGSVQVLSSPRVAAINNQKAVLRVGTDDFFITNVSTTTTSGAGGTVTTPTITVQPFFSGISLDVTPEIDDTDMVTMHVRPSVSAVSERTRVVSLGTAGTFTLPLASSNVNETDTVVRVADGNIVAIGGLMQDEQDATKSQVPGAGDTPVVGQLFKQTSRSAQKSELVFLIKATVVKGDEAWRDDLASTEKRVREMELPARSLPERLGN